MIDESKAMLTLIALLEEIGQKEKCFFVVHLPLKRGGHYVVEIKVVSSKEDHLRLIKPESLED